MSHNLKDLQAWFQSVITHPDGVRRGVLAAQSPGPMAVTPPDIERVVLPSNELSSFDRLQIYGSAYFGRLIECLGVQFPAVQHAVGEDTFKAFAYGYLIQHPSTSYTLALLGQSFVEYLNAIRPARDLAANAIPDFADFVIDLALLEQTYADVFDGPGPEATEPLRAEVFAGLDANSFANCRLVTFDCVRLLKLRFAVHRYASALRQGREPELSEPQTTHLVVTRRDFIVRRYEVSEPQYRLLSLLQQNATIGEALLALFDDPTIDPATIQNQLQSWFQEWTAAPLFARVTD